MNTIKKLFLSFMVCILLFSTVGTAYAEQNGQVNSSSFIDVPKTHWAYKEMMYMVENKIITGYGNGYFGAADPITREHLAAFLYRYLKPQDSTNNPFVDIGDSNFKKEILALTARGIFSVNAEKKFNPKNNMTRAEMATVLVKTFDLKPQGNVEFTDMKGHWANEYVKILAGNNITSGTGDGNFNPNGIVTREQFSMFLYRTIMKVTDMQNDESVGWVKEKENWYYYNKDGSKQRDNITLDGIEYSFFKDGRLFQGRKQVGKDTLYYSEPGKLKTGWSFSATSWSYLKDGKYVTGTFTYQGKPFEINKYGDMEKGWITLRSAVKRIYPKPETKFLFKSKTVKDGDVLEVISKQGLWYQVKYQGEIGYVRVLESVVIGESPVRSWDVAKEATNLSHFMITEYHKDPEKYFPPNIHKKFDKQLDSDLTLLANGLQWIDQLKEALYLDNKQGWVQEEGKWTYYKKDGQRITGFQSIDGKRYYFGTDGFMQTGWVHTNGYDYYLGTDGVVQTGIQHIDGKIYYFGPLGPVQSGFTHVDGKPYYFDASHESRNGWMKQEFNWYLLQPSGALQTGDFTYKDKKFSFNQDGEMIKGWVTLESLVKKVYPEPDLKKALRAKSVNKGEVIEVVGKVGSWYEVNYQGEKGYVRIHDAIIFDQEAKSPLTLLDGKIKIFEGVLDYLKSDEPFINNTIKILEEEEQRLLDDAETWESISSNINNAKQDAQYKMQLMKESHDKMQELVNAMKGDIKNLTVTQRKELFKLLGNTRDDVLAYGKEWMGFSADVYTTILQNYGELYQAYADYYKALDVVSGKWSDFLKDVADATVEIEKNHRKLAEGLSGVVKDLGPVVNSSIRWKHSIDEAKPGMEELVQVTRKNAPVIAKDLQALDAKVPGFFTDFNMGIDLANTFMDSANKIASHKVDVSAAARNIGNIDLSSALYDLGGDPSRIYNRANDGDLSFVLGITPIIGTGKEIGQLIKGEDLVTGQKYGPDDYAWGTLAVVSGGTTRVVGKVVGKIGDLEKKGKALEAAAKGGRSGEIVLDKVQTYEQARNKAMSLLGDLGADSQPFIGTMEKSAGYGKIVGRKTADNKARWRLDYDPNKGMHINVEDFRNGKKEQAIKYAIPFEGNEETFKALLKHLNN
ncbi:MULTISPECIES: S-layer homology domain-containing protein [Bacillus]|uniref:S-layer protein n=1 Tax=Bacillus anthracis TaxID=1392 RepID=A0A0J1HUQ0_BACAN|nr:MULTISPECIES: S-layer homology domain-containing protein [Bacillus cereus group]MCU7392800.1 S-layer homology domain-containing protein [Bacillus sp. ST24]KLV17426.1 S-layer protein [Bacillus anthracis]KMP66836.1 S-layer protein [Bacillus cereus]MCC2430812.1 S-layer homology domain-containing protein [Bacillus paranthracis]MCU5202779.1 S-layer homology domain-containing protein [Bacillus paranthracis]